jgi:hypothetical protein
MLSASRSSFLLGGPAQQRLPILDLRLALTGALDSRITFTRASAAWDTDLNGNIVEFASGAPQVQAGIGLGIWEARTTKPLYSRCGSQLLSAVLASVPAEASVVSETNPASLLTNGGNVLQIDNSAGGSPVTVQMLGTVGSTSAHSLQTFARRVSGDPSTFQLEGAAETTSISATTYSRLKSENRTPADINRRFEVTVPAGAVARLAAWDAQLGAFCTPFIDATGAQKTRSADLASLLVSAIPGWNATQGTVVVHGNSRSPAAANATIVQIDNGASANIVPTLYHQTDEQAVFLIRTNETNRFATGFGALTDGLDWSMAAAFESGSNAAALNGTLGLTNSTAWTPSAATTTLRLGHNQISGSLLNGYFRRLRIFNSRRPNAQLPGLAT